MSQEKVRDGVDIFTCRLTSKFLQIGIIVVDGVDQTCTKYPK